MAISKLIFNGVTQMDVTQDTVAANNLLSGETATKNDGTQVTGTYVPPASITVSPLSVTQNGTYTATTGTAYSPVTVNVSGGGGGGLVYETGTYTPTENIARPTITFSNTHTEPPIYISFSDSDDTYLSTTNTQFVFVYADWWRLTGNGIAVNNTGTFSYCMTRYVYRQTAADSLTQGGTLFQYNSDNPTSSNSNYPRYFATETAFYPNSNSTSRYWRTGRTYKWIAVWKPTA